MLDPDQLKSERDLELLEFIVDRVNVGVFIVNSDMEILLWNRFMHIHSNKSESDVIGKNLFDCFHELPQKWFEKKINGVLMLKNFSFTSWEQRPYIFQFPHNRPATGGVDWMYQNLGLMPIKNKAGVVDRVCVVVHDVTDVGIYQNKLKNVLEQLEQANRIDGMTGLYNRSHWEKRLSEEFSRAGRYGGTLSLVMFDIDKFKVINDTYGHLAGDSVLRVVANKTLELLRECDIPGRYGGEEFGIILPSTDVDGAEQVAEKLRRNIAATVVDFEGQRIEYTISAGITELTDKITNHEELISQADAALYCSKSKGRNCVNTFPIIKNVNAKNPQRPSAQ